MASLSLPACAFQSNLPVLNRAFRIALGDLYGNIAPHFSGLLESARPTVLAGLDYDTPWTRDAAINCWNGASLIAPEVARDTLLGVLERNDGAVCIGGEYWDKIIWVTGAWHHYLVTGDSAFLSVALEASLHALERMEADEFDAKENLFRGGACFQDGVAGYPDRYVRNHATSGIVHWVAGNPDERVPAGFGLPIMACSTNCLYYSAYLCAAKMLREAGRPGAEALEAKAARLKEAILAHFWDEETGSLFYLLDDRETCRSQEGLGSAFAILLGVLDDKQTARVLASQHITPHGVSCVWPSF